MTMNEKLHQPTKEKSNGLSGEFLPHLSETSANIEGFQTYDEKAQEYDKQNDGEDDFVMKKRVRIRVPVIRNRNTKDHALTVVRRRPLVPYTKSSLSQLEITPSPTTRRLITRTRLRNIDTIDVSNRLGNDLLNDVSTNNNRHKVTVTRRRKIRPTATISSSHRERLTRKKLVTVRPIPEPTSTLAIITTGFYTAPPVKEDEAYFDDDDNYDDELFLPDLHTSSEFQNTVFPQTSSETKKLISHHEKTSTSSDPIIITDNFFFPISFEETTTNDNSNDSEETDTKPYDSMDETTESNLEMEDVTEKSEDEEISTEKEIQVTTPGIVDITNETTTIVDDDGESTTPYEVEANPVESNVQNNDDNNHEKNESTLMISSSDALDNSVTQSPPETVTNDTEDSLRVIPIMAQLNIGLENIANPTQSKELFSSSDHAFESSVDLDSSDIPTVIPLEIKSSITTDLSDIKTKLTPVSNVQVTSSLSQLTPEDIEAGLTDDLYLSLSRPDFPQISPSKVEPDVNITLKSDSSQITPDLQTSIYYSETVVTSTRLRTYTYVVTKLNGQETEVTSSTTVRPRVTTLTLTVPVTVTVTPTLVSSSVALSSSLGEYLSNPRTDLSEPV